MLAITTFGAGETFSVLIVSRYSTSALLDCIQLALQPYEIERLRSTLIPITDEDNCLARKWLKTAVLVVEESGRHVVLKYSQRISWTLDG